MYNCFSPLIFSVIMTFMAFNYTHNSHKQFYITREKTNETSTEKSASKQISRSEKFPCDVINALSSCLLFVFMWIHRVCGSFFITIIIMNVSFFILFSYAVVVVVQTFCRYHRCCNVKCTNFTLHSIHTGTCEHQCRHRI